ncbi:ABC transporter permease [Actinomadura sp. NEAU-AAG7]|uniref:ABC transporter permease n=1 Tax=Actinomadura sp. NEAU-AAG7 TaxID=2839640 RepID=UPI001BE3F875|nr:FtsX-like permease family protein [Actinomadura sp. NEAU-AAG7]MBT2209335.1 ABC transporter permease [Actinomadura sp. NEAU-AAG7]
MLKTVLAGLLAHKLRLVLTGVAITLGVGFISGTFVLTDTVEKGIDAQFAASADRVDVAVLPKKPGPELPAALLARVRAVPGVTEAHAMVQGEAALVGADGKVVGDSPTAGLSVSDGTLQRYEIKQGRAPRGPSEAVVDDGTAASQKFRLGQSITILDRRERPHRFTMVGVVDFGVASGTAMNGAVGFDTPTALRMTGMRTLKEIDVLGGDKAAVAGAVGGSFDVLTGKELGDRLVAEVGGDTEIIRIGLLIFGLISMLVSALVIYNTFSILIAQRTREMALLRCVGASRKQVFGGVVAESAAVGLAGSVFGVVAGLGLGHGSIALFNAMGAEIATAGFGLSPRTVVIGLLVGVLVTVVSALLPARAATRVAPIAALRTDHEPGGGRFRLAWPRATAAGVLGVSGLALGVHGSLIMKKGGSAISMVGIAGLLVFLAIIAMMPAFVRPLGWLVGAIPARIGGVPGRLAVENARRSPRRTATTTIALTIGIGLMSLFAVIASSAKASTSAQLDKEFPVDFQLEAQFSDGETPRTIPHELAAALRGVPQVGEVGEMRVRRSEVDGRPEEVGTLNTGALGTIIKLDFSKGALADLKPGTVAVNSDVAKSRGFGPGATIKIKTRRGVVPAKVTGVFGGDAPAPSILMTEPDFGRQFGAVDPTEIYVNAKEGVPAADARSAVEQAAKPYATVKVRSVVEVKKELTKIIDMVLMIFAGMLGLAIIIALFGIANTLTLSVVERTRESALLRALGITKRQLRRMLSVEALVMGVIGALTGVGFGMTLGWAATNAMAKSAIFAVPVLQIIGFVVLAGAAGMLAAVLPARRASKASIVESLASE